MASCKLEDMMFDAYLTTRLPSGKSQRARTPTSVLALHQYILDCNKYGAIPVDQFLRHVEEERFVMRFYGLGPLGAKAISRPLENNTHIRSLDLEGNSIGQKGALYLASSLRDNVYITDLNLAENNLGRHGVAAVIEMMRENSTITQLDLSGNELSDRDGRIFFYLLKHNHALKELCLRHNTLGDVTSNWLLEAFSINDTLHILDISWNHFRKSAAVDLANMLADNSSLRELHMCMNGLGPEGATAMSKVLISNSTLEVLDISANRIPTAGAISIGAGLEENETLKVIKIGRNPITPIGALGLIKAVERNTSSGLQLLDMEGIDVPLEFEVIEVQLAKTRKLKVIRGEVIAKRWTPDIRVPPPIFEDMEAKFLDDPLTKLRQYCNKRQIRLLDLFKQFDKDQSWSVSREELSNGIRSRNIDISDEHMECLLNKLDKDGDGDIDYKEICCGDRENKKERIHAARSNREQKQLIEEHHKQQGKPRPKPQEDSEIQEDLI